MKKSILIPLLMAVCSSTAFAESDTQTQTLDLTESQQQAFGLHFSAIEVVTDFQSPTWRGVVSVPIGQSHVISAGAGGLLNLHELTEGARIEPNQVLAQIDSAHSLTLQREALAVMSDLDLAKQNLVRDEGLADSGVVAQKRLQTSRAEVANLSRKLDEVWQNLALMGMAPDALQALKTSRKLQSARLNLTATAPGLITKILARSGERVAENQPIIQWQQTSPLWLSLTVSLSQAQGLQVGQTVSVDGLDSQGEILMVDGRVDSMTQSVKVVVALPQEATYLRPGQSLNAQFVFSQSDLIRVPSKALIHFDDQVWLFVKQAGQLQALSVTLLARDDQQATVQVAQAAQWAKGQVVSKGSAALKAMLTGEED